MRTTNPAGTTSSPHPARPGSLPPLALLALLATGCGDGPGGPRDPAEDILLTPVTEEVFTVGSVTGDAWDTFGNVRDVAFDAEANLHIFDSQSAHVHMVGPDGSLIRTVGGPGEGPGELNDPSSLIVARDGSYTVLGFGSIDLFEPGGEFAERITVNIFTTGSIVADRAFPDGRLVTPFVAGLDDEDEPDFGRPIYVYPPGDADTEIFYTAWELPEEEEYESEIDFSEGVMRMRLPAGRAFEPRLAYDVLTDGRLAVVDSIGYRIKLIGPDGSVDGTVERPIAPLPVDETIMEAARERYRETTSAVVESFDRQNLGTVERAGAEELTFADEVPVIYGIKVDWEDRIWVERRDPTGTAGGPIDIVTPAGDYIGTLPLDGLRTPRAFGPDGLMAFVETDELDVPTVRVVRLASLDPAGSGNEPARQRSGIRPESTIRASCISVSVK